VPVALPVPAVLPVPVALPEPTALPVPVVLPEPVAPPLVVPPVVVEVAPLPVEPVFVEGPPEESSSEPLSQAPSARHTTTLPKPTHCSTVRRRILGILSPSPTGLEPELSREWPSCRQKCDG
jgi:hypothetical protein